MNAATKPKQRSVRVFLSYAREDQPLARMVRDVFSRFPFVTVFSSDVLSAGENWETKLRSELTRADIVAVLISPDSVGSSWVLRELGAAWGLQKNIVPLVTSPELLGKLPIQLNETASISLDEVVTKDGAERLMQDFEKLSGLMAPRA